MKRFFIIFGIGFIVLLSGCDSSTPPSHPNNLCRVFRDRPTWYWAAKESRHKWHIPISVQMAIMHQESHFLSGAEPPRKKLFGKIPWFRPTTALGYAQAVDETWRRYVKSVGKVSAGRDDFSDAVDFIGWYAHLLHRKLGIANSDARSIYLAYHEGMDGYHRRTYLNKLWLLHVANKVQRHATRYRKQLLRCEKHLPNKPFWWFW